MMKQKETKGKKLLESKKFNLTITIVNLALIVLLVGCLIFMYVRNSGGKNSGQDGAKKIDEVTVDQLMSEADESMLNVYKVLLQGSNFKLENGMSFRFGIDNTFSGYFDSDNTDVEGYLYDIIVGDSNAICLQIYNSDKSKLVQYEMSFDNNGNILLTYEGMDPLVLAY